MQNLYYNTLTMTVKINQNKSLGLTALKSMLIDGSERKSRNVRRKL